MAQTIVAIYVSVSLSLSIALHSMDMWMYTIWRQHFHERPKNAWNFNFFQILCCILWADGISWHAMKWTQNVEMKKNTFSAASEFDYCCWWWGEEEIKKNQLTNVLYTLDIDWRKTFCWVKFLIGNDRIWFETKQNEIRAIDGCRLLRTVVRFYSSLSVVLPTRNLP